MQCVHGGHATPRSLPPSPSIGGIVSGHLILYSSTCFLNTANPVPAVRSFVRSFVRPTHTAHTLYPINVPSDQQVLDSYPDVRLGHNELCSHDDTPTSRRICCHLVGTHALCTGYRRDHDHAQVPQQHGCRFLHGKRCGHVTALFHALPSVRIDILAGRQFKDQRLVGHHGRLSVFVQNDGQWHL